MFRKILPATVLTLSTLFGAAFAPAQAAPLLLLGSQVDREVWVDVIGPQTQGWEFIGESIGPTSPDGMMIRRRKRG